MFPGVLSAKMGPKGCVMPPIPLADPDMTLSAIMTEWPETIPVFLRHRMLCVGCLITPFHTLTDACAEYGLDEARFRSELRAAIEGKKTPRPGPA